MRLEAAQEVKEEEQEWGGGPLRGAPGSCTSGEGGEAGGVCVQICSQGNLTQQSDETESLVHDTLPIPVSSERSNAPTIVEGGKEGSCSSLP